MRPLRRSSGPLAALAFVVMLGAAAALSPAPADATILVDNTSSAAGPNQNQQTLTWTHTVLSSNAILIVGVATRQGSAPSSVTYGGKALTKAISITDSDGNNAATLYYWPSSNGALPVGSASVIVTMPSNNFAIAAGAESFTGVYLASPIDATASNQNNNSAMPTLTISVAANEVVVDALAANGGISLPTPGASQTPEWRICSGTCDGGQIIGAGSIDSVGASPLPSVTDSWTMQKAEQWSLVALALKPTPTAALTVAKTGSTASSAGGLIAYSVLVTNAGPSAANGTAFSDPVPAGVTIVGTPACAVTSGSAVCGSVTVAGQNVTSTITTLPANASVTFTMYGTAASAGSYTNVASITPPSGVIDPNPTTSSLTTVVASTGVTKTVQNMTEGDTGGSFDNGKPGDVLQYVLSFTNTTGVALPNFKLTDTVPASTTYSAGTAACVTVPTGLTCTPSYAAGVVTWQFTGGSLAAGATATVKFQVTVN